jgi:predicted DNA-binding protein
MVHIWIEGGIVVTNRSFKRAPKSVRASVSFPTGVYEELEKLAAAKKVSLAWVVREAAEKYVSDQWPLFAPSAEERQ